MIAVQYIYILNGCN